MSTSANFVVKNGLTVGTTPVFASNGALISTISNTAVSPGTYGGSSQIPVIIVGSDGRLTSAANVSVTIPSSTLVFANSGQLTSNSSTGTGNILLGLATVGTAGTYANANTVAVISTDSYGRVSSVTNTPIQINIAQVTGLQGVDDTQNTNISAASSYANSAFSTANSASSYANSSFVQANGAYSTANSASSYANGAFVQANAAFNTANSAGSYANSAFTAANSKFSSSGGTISGNVTISGSLSVTGNITYTGNVINQTISGNTGEFFGTSANGFGALYAGVPTGYTFEPQTIIQSTGNYNDYVQINLQNLNNGANATADYTATSDNGTANDGYIDMGITSSTYSNPNYNLFGPNDGYVYTSGNTTTGGGNLIFYTNTPKDIVFAANGATTGNEIARFKYNTGLVLKSLPLTFADSTTQNTAAAPFSFSNSIFVQANSAYSTANAAGSYANSAFLAANSAGSYGNSAFTTANSAGVYANGAYAAANAGFNTANSASSYANGAFVQANSAYSTANSAGSYANSAFLAANSAGSYSNSAFTTANSAGAYANAAFLQANSAYAHSNTTSNTFVGTNGTSATPTNSSLTFASNNGILVSGSGNTITISDAQDIRTTATPTFNGLSVNSYAVMTSTIYVTGSTAQNTIDSFSTSTYRSAKYQAQMTSGSSYHMIELNVISDGTTPYLSQYGEIFTGSSLGAFDVSITTGTLYLLFTPTNAATTIKLLRTAITV